MRYFLIISLICFCSVPSLAQKDMESLKKTNQELQTEINELKKQIDKIKDRTFSFFDRKQELESEGSGSEKESVEELLEKIYSFNSISDLVDADAEEHFIDGMLQDQSFQDYEYYRRIRLMYRVVYDDNTEFDKTTIDHLLLNKGITFNYVKEHHRSDFVADYDKIVKILSDYELTRKEYDHITDWLSKNWEAYTKDIDKPLTTEKVVKQLKEDYEITFVKENPKLMEKLREFIKDQLKKTKI